MSPLLRRVFLSENDVDWSRTRAWATGHMGQINVNLKGREPRGIVSKSEVPALRAGDRGGAREARRARHRPARRRPARAARGPLPRRDGLARVGLLRPDAPARVPGARRRLLHLEPRARALVGQQRDAPDERHPADEGPAGAARRARRRASASSTSPATSSTGWGSGSPRTSTRGSPPRSTSPARSTRIPRGRCRSPRSSHPDPGKELSPEEIARMKENLEKLGYVD